MNISNEPLVYLIILNYKGYEDTCECVDNLLQQDYVNYKILIVDNDSQDESYEKLVCRYPDLQVIQTGENLGYAGGNNVGIQIAMQNGAKYIGILNNDIKAESNLISEMIKAFEGDEKLGMAGPAICEWEKDEIQSAGANVNMFTTNTTLNYRSQNYQMIPKTPIECDYVGGAAMFVRKKVIEDIGNIPEIYFLFFEETEWCIHARKKKYKVQCIPSVRIWHKESSAVNKISDMKLYYQDRNKVIFEKRNATKFQFFVFVIYDLLQIVIRKILKRYPTAGFKAFFEGVSVNGKRKNTMD